MFRSDPKAFDLVVTDLAMPPMTGFDVAQAVLALRPEVPVLLTSGYMRTEDRDAAVALGVRDVLPKPTTRELLGRTLRHALDTTDGSDFAGLHQA
jgi:CheY-like chemotaxis protein